MSMFDKLVRKGGKLAGELLRDQLAQRGQGAGATGRQHTGRPQTGRQGWPGAGPDRRTPQQGPFAAAREHGAGRPGAGPQAGVSPADQAAIAKYRYMLRTAPPEDMERAHAEAFARLAPQQRALVRAELSEQLPPTERPRSDQPFDLARAATRAELSRPGVLERVLGRSGGGRGGLGQAGGLAAGTAGGLGAGLGAGLLAGVAGAFVGSAVAGPLLEGFAGFGEELGGAAEGLADGVAGAGEGLLGAGGELLGAGSEFAGAGGEFLTAGDGVVEQAGGAFDGLRTAGEGFLGGGGGGFFGDFEI